MSNTIEAGPVPTAEQLGIREPGQVTASEVARRRPAAVGPSNALIDTMSVMAVMERMARNKEVDTTKLAQIREFAEAMLSDQRRTAFDAALAEMQADLPTISARGTIEIRAKDTKGDRTGRVIQSTKYAKWEDINEAIKPVLKKHGFVLRFETGLAYDGRIKVTGILAGHGHRERSEFILQHDATGSKNAVQAVGSSTSYGKRYAAGALLNLTSRGEDDDGRLGGGEPSEGFPGDKTSFITSDQITALVDECKRVGCPRDKFLAWADIASFEEIRADAFAGCMSGLASFTKAKK
jgi:hypothetical protein